MPAPHHSFLQAGCSCWCPANNVNALKAIASKVWTLRNKSLLFIHSLWQGVNLNQQSTVRTAHVCVSLYTTVIHNTAQNGSDNLLSYLPGSHHCWDVVCWRRGGPAGGQWQLRYRSTEIDFCCCQLLNDFAIICSKFFCSGQMEIVTSERSQSAIFAGIQHKMILLWHMAPFLLVYAYHTHCHRHHHILLLWSWQTQLITCVIIINYYIILYIIVIYYYYYI